MAGSLENKVAVVTGGNSGLGLAIAQRFADSGASVVITGRRQPELDAAVAQLGPKVSAVRADVSKLAELDALYASVKAKYGRIDVLVANAGMAELAPLGEITEEHFDKTFDTNVKGLLFTVQKALPLLTKGSSIILIGSAVSISPPAGMSVYGGTKAAVRNFVRSWIQELKGKGIRINVLSPGPINTPGLLGLVPPEQHDAFLAMLRDRIPLGRVGEPGEVGRTALFLASDESSFINGVELFVDGGRAQV